jgi:hypothetical protein
VRFLVAINWTTAVSLLVIGAALVFAGLIGFSSKLGQGDAFFSILSFFIGSLLFVVGLVMVVIHAIRAVAISDRP